jgi:hypothetical protein
MTVALQTSMDDTRVIILRSFEFCVLVGEPFQCIKMYLESFIVARQVLRLESFTESCFRSHLDVLLL